MCQAGSLLCTSLSIQPCFLFVPNHKSIPAAVMTLCKCQQNSLLSSIKVRFGSKQLEKESSD